MNLQTEGILKEKGVRQLDVRQNCINKSCNSQYKMDKMLHSCEKCGQRLEFVFEGKYFNKQYNYDSQWKNFDLIPLMSSNNIHSLGEGGSPLVEMEELSATLNGARLFIMLDSDKNPTGTFKDREASIVLSRCKELGLDNLVFYSTANTGRAYMHYAAELGLTTYLFMPESCHYKMTKHISKSKNNHLIYVDNSYPQISPYVKKFTEANRLTLIAPLHERNESYATVAYEQHQMMPKCDFFVQTIASGMGPIGFLRGHKNLVKFGIQKKEFIPKIICVQSSEMNVMSRAYNKNLSSLTSDNLPKSFPSKLFEPTLNSTNPVNNYPDLYNCLKESNGIITDVTPEYVKEKAQPIIDAFLKRNFTLRTDLENSILIEYAGLIQLAEKKRFKKDEIIVMLACGRGRDKSNELYRPDAVINVEQQDVIQLKSILESVN